MESRNILLAALALAGLTATLFVLGNQPEYPVSELEDLLYVFERKIRPILKSKPGYSLPPIEAGKRELDYLRSLHELLTLHTDDCEATARSILTRHQAFEEDRKHSIFRDAARVVSRQKDQDFVHDLSSQIGTGDGPGLRPRVRPVEVVRVEEKIRVLQAKTDKIKLVNSAAGLLEQLIESVDDFASDCPQESDVLHTALGYFEN